MEEKTIIPIIEYSCEEEDNDVELPFQGMRKMTVKQEKEFPMIVVDSMICQSRYIARFERCTGCSFAIGGCEKVVEMSAG